VPTHGLEVRRLLEARQRIGLEAEDAPLDHADSMSNSTSGTWLAGFSIHAK
jgi:hypothetical protein